jgi:hypothetical protein
MSENNRDLDLYMAQKVLGHTTYYEQSGALRERLPDGQTRPLAFYSRDIGAAWAVVEKLGVTVVPVESGFFALVGPMPRWPTPAEFLKYLSNTDFTKSGAALADQAAESICLAALRALETREAAAKEMLDAADADVDLPN